MSLLLEALKKAEKAKEEAQRRAQSQAPASELRLEPEVAAPEEAKPVVTRAELPDIRQPLEILSDDIGEKRAPAAPPEPHAATASQTRVAQSHTDQRATAKKVFEAKFREPNPRLPFYIALGVLGVCAVGVVVYFWYQLRPPPPLVNANPPRTGQEVAVAPKVAPAPSVKPVAVAPVAVQGLPPVAQPEPPRIPTVQPRIPTVQPRVPVGQREVAVRAPPPAQPLIPVAQTTRSAPQIHPKVESGYAAYLAGDFARSRADYQDALREDAGNRDALLGLAALDVRGARFESAEATYLRLLQSDPNDAHAQAGLIALRASRLDPLATESRVKNLLAADPGANVLHFTLGNQLAQQARWAEAQQEYFKAFAADPENADFAYNLAVSLDHLRQPKLALEYYRRAVALAEKRAASFDLAAARRRVADLDR